VSWSLRFGVGAVAVLSIAAVVVALMSAGGPSGASLVRGAVRWPTTCGRVLIDRPSRAPIASQWGSLATQTADIVCGSTRSRVVYATFSDSNTLDQALLAHAPADRYCVDGDSVELDELASVDLTVFSDMCRDLGGTVFSNLP
jgi:hypothetical protein